MNRTATLCVAALLLGLAGCASTLERADYAGYAGASVPEISFTHLYNWQRTGDRQMVIWTKPSAAYLLTLRNKCDALDGRATVQIGGVDGISGRLQSGYGDVIVGQMHCRVDAIQPIDLVRMRRDQRS